jgi:hypothetical protein
MYFPRTRSRATKQNPRKLKKMKLFFGWRAPMGPIDRNINQVELPAIACSIASRSTISSNNANQHLLACYVVSEWASFATILIFQVSYVATKKV